ncbi:MAG: hypothetical protein SVY41_02535 [Candidatus Nanohaloarchaea archaeon]|nr:hypothetical protein [Candidatus Nanohaloarchaea archaeon]
MDWPDIDWDDDRNDQLHQAGIILTRLVVVAATLLGAYLLFSGDTVLHRAFGLVMVLVGGYLIYHHSIVISRRSLR